MGVYGPTSHTEHGALVPGCVAVSPSFFSPREWLNGARHLTGVILRTALDAERELLRCLAEKEPTFAEISHFLAE